MKLRTNSLAIIASLATIAGSQAAVLLSPGSTEVLYTLGESGANFTTNFQDSSGNNRNMTGGAGVDYNVGVTTWTGSPIPSTGSSASLMIVNSNAKWNMSNASGISSDYQVTIFLESSNTWGGDPNPTGVQTIFDMDGISFKRQGLNYYGVVNGSTVGNLTTTEWAGTGLMFQKVNDVFSFWTSNNGGITWTQQGSDVTAAGFGDDWSTSHIFVKPGGGENYTGYADNFKVVAIPEPGASLLGGIGLLALLRRRRD